MTTRKEAIKEVLSERIDEDIDNEMVQADILMDAEQVSNDKYEFTETAIIDVKEIHREIESKRRRAITSTPSGRD